MGTPTVIAKLRRLALVAHVASSVGWLGAVVAFLALAVLVASTDDPELMRPALWAMYALIIYALVPMALFALIVAISQSLVSSWGLVRHWWVVIKLIVTVPAVVVLLQYTSTMGNIAAMAADESSVATLRSLAMSPALHASAALLVLLLATVLSVYKPRGLTPYGWRKEEERRLALQRR